VFRRSRKFAAAPHYNSGMIILRAPSGAPQELGHAIELVNRDIEELLDHLSTKQQNQFWENLHQFALAETKNERRNPGLLATEHVDITVREALQMADEKLETHLKDLSKDHRDRFWRMLHDAAEQQAHDTKQPKSRHGGGGESA
jgi:hypothetical protein